MDIEIMKTQVEQDLEELAKEYDAAADNERLWSRGDPTLEGTLTHIENCKHNEKMAKLYRTLASMSLALIETFAEEN